MLIKFFRPVESLMDKSMMHHQHTTTFNQHLIGMWLGFIVIAVISAWVIIGLLKSIRHKENLLLKANLKQAENDKILSLATLATGSAHELGTPLATINILVREMLNDSEINTYHPSLSMIESQIYRCKDSLAKITASTGTTQAIKGSIESLPLFIKQIESQIMVPKGLDFKLNQVLKNQDFLLTDKTLVQAVVNILNNAFESGAKAVSLSFFSTKQNIKIVIDDNGAGLQSPLGHTVESEKDFGMGLGLFLAHATIQRFAGSIDVESQATQGTKLTITLPKNNDE